MSRRPYMGRMFSFRLTEAELCELRAYAIERNISLSKALRMVLRTELSKKYCPIRK